MNKELLNFRIITAKLKLEYIIDPKEGTKRKTIPSSIKPQIWETYISKKDRIGKCFCCRTKDIYSDDYEAGHVISDKDGGKWEIKNLRPVCSKCNKSMGKENMYKFICDGNFWK